MSDIYEQHAAAFRRVAAFVIMKREERVATVAFKFPADGAGRLYAYVHILGTEMVRGFAGGGGYNKKSAAVAAAARKLPAGLSVWNSSPEETAALVAALSEDGGRHWDQAARAAGFEIIQAV